MTVMMLVVSSVKVDWNKFYVSLFQPALSIFPLETFTGNEKGKEIFQNGILETPSYFCNMVADTLSGNRVVENFGNVHACVGEI